ncbi:MAG: hypothetical protein R3C03_06960 [Pirellulaceae bacterium]
MMNRFDCAGIASPLLVILLVLFCIIAGCQSRATIVTNAGVRLTASSDTGNVTMTQDASGKATVSTGGHTIQLNGIRIELDGKAISDIPEGTKHLDVSVAAGEISIKADGKHFYSSSSK